MIETKQDLTEFLEYEKPLYKSSNSWIQCVLSELKAELKTYRWKYIKYLRKAEYYYFHRKENPICLLMYIYYARKKNKLGIKLNLDVKEYVFDKGLVIHHTGAIVVNSCAKVGKNCVLHGNNVIGNMGENTGAPVIGDNVRLGIGSKVLGDIYIADGVQIGAGALVIHSCYEKGALLTGVPATIKSRVVTERI